MIITTRDKKEQDLYIAAFKNHFIHRFGVVPEIIINDQEVLDVITTSLDELEEIIQRFIPPHIAKRYPRFITKNRKRELVILRMIFMMLAKDMDYSLAFIGEHCGGRDHSTVLYNISTGYDLLETNQEFQELFISISQIVNPKLYPDARISQVIDETQDQCQSISIDSLHTRKYKVFRPTTGHERRAFTSKTERAYNGQELAVA